MRPNNNQQQNSQDRCLLQLAPIHETSLTHKVLQLDIQMQQTQKYYQTAKKPIKYFSKVKRSLVESKNTQRNCQIGILSQKIIAPNIGQNLNYAQKPTLLQNPRLKNVFEAYKQTLQQKYRKRKRQMEKTALKINTSKIHDNEITSQQIINEKQQLIMKRLSNKRLDPSIIGSYQPSPMHRSSLIKSVRQKQQSSRLMETIDDSGHNFVRSMNKKQQIRLVLPHEHSTSNKQMNLYQVKRKCYTQQRQNQPVKVQDLNKTRNISFRLPSEKRKSIKHFMQKIGGHTYNLPQISDKLNYEDQKISYLVKSLRKPSVSQNSKQLINPQIKFMPSIQEPFEKLTNNKNNRRIRTLQIQNDTSIFTQCSFQNENEAPYQHKCRKYLKSKKSSKYQIKQGKTKRKFAKINLMGEIDGWNTQNQIPSIESHNFHHFISHQSHEVTHQE